MELLQTNQHHSLTTNVEPLTQVALENYMDSVQAQPLASLVEEIIAFQLEERALYVNFEHSTNFLN